MLRKSSNTDLYELSSLFTTRKARSNVLTKISGAKA
jgi:hypothetical protein